MQGFFNEFALDFVTATGERLPVIANAVERRDADGLRATDPLGESFDPPIVHQETDGTPVDAEYRLGQTRFQHAV